MENMQLKSCTCGATPQREITRISCGKVTDGGYTLKHGRYKCPACGKAPSWGSCYCVEYEQGWINNAIVWNKMIGGETNGQDVEGKGQAL